MARAKKAEKERRTSRNEVEKEVEKLQVGMSVISDILDVNLNLMKKMKKDVEDIRLSNGALWVVFLIYAITVQFGLKGFIIAMTVWAFLKLLNYYKRRWF